MCKEAFSNKSHFHFDGCFTILFHLVKSTHALKSEKVELFQNFNSVLQLKLNSALWQILIASTLVFPQRDKTKTKYWSVTNISRFKLTTGQSSSFKSH